MALSEEVRRAIHGMAGEDGWWHSGGEETFIEVAETLAGQGLDDDTIIESLSASYGAAAGEFGG